MAVALRKESVDRNRPTIKYRPSVGRSLSARRAWIEIVKLFRQNYECFKSLSARRAWIEIWLGIALARMYHSRSPQGERG